MSENFCSKNVITAAVGYTIAPEGFAFNISLFNGTNFV